MTSTAAHHVDRLAIGGFASLSIIVLGYTAFVPRPAQNVAVIFSPWISQGEAVRRVAASGAMIVRAGRLPFIVIAYPGDRSTVLKALGENAWLVLDGTAFSGCAGSSK